MDPIDTGQVVSPFSSVYDTTDVSPFPGSAAVYWMDGWSDVEFVVRDSNEKAYFAFTDRNTSISASSPFVFDGDRAKSGIYTPVPQPLDPISFVPLDTPTRYTRQTTTHMMQVISMNMQHESGKARLLIGLPYAERYPETFFDSKLYPDGIADASSYGIVQSLTEFSDPVTFTREVTSNGYPARSFFAIFHILETPLGVFFNKKATQMELQPSNSGKLALKMPPIPFRYTLINGPIPLFDIERPNDPPVADLISARHHDGGAARAATESAWPFHQPDEIDRILSVKGELKSESR